MMMVEIFVNYAVSRCKVLAAELWHNDNDIDDNIDDNDNYIDDVRFWLFGAS